MSQSRPSKRQKEVLDFITSFIAEHGYGPSYREIQEGCNYRSVATAAVHVNALVGKGLLRKRDNLARSLELVTNHTDDDKAWLLQRLQDLEVGAMPLVKRQMVYQGLELLGLAEIVKQYENSQ